MEKGTAVALGLGVLAVGAYLVSSSSSSPSKKGADVKASGKYASLSDVQLMRAIVRGESPSTLLLSDPMIQRLEYDYSISKGTMPASKEDPAFIAYLEQRIKTNVDTLASKDPDGLYLLEVEARVAQDELAGNDLLVELLAEVEDRAHERGGKEA
jgi:hypothetical protein